MTENRHRPTVHSSRIILIADSTLRIALRVASNKAVGYAFAALVAGTGCVGAGTEPSATPDPTMTSSETEALDKAFVDRGTIDYRPWYRYRGVSHGPGDPRRDLGSPKDTPDLEREHDLRPPDDLEHVVHEAPDLKMEETPDMERVEPPDLAMHPRDLEVARDLEPARDLARLSDLSSTSVAGLPVIPETLFGMHIHNADTNAIWPTVPFGAWRMWDSHTAWPQIEPSQGNFSWTALDKDVSLAEAHNIDIDLVLGLSPTWASARPTESSGYGPGEAAEPKNMSDWTAYITAVATRYKGRIHTYEIWNEPDSKSFYTGTTATMVELVKLANQTLKAIDPTIIVVSPSQTNDYHGTWLDGFLTAGGGPYIDVVGYHFYYWPNPPEGKIPHITAVKGVMAKHGLSSLPLWDTESGWLIEDQNTTVTAGSGQRVLGFPEASADIARTFLVEWAEGIQRWYFYAWDDGSMGLTEADRKTVKPPATAWTEVEGWMAGASFGGCTTSSSGTWSCKLERSGGYVAYAVWNVNGNVSYAVPSGVQTSRDLTGATESLAGMSTVTIGTSPLLLEAP